MGISSGLSLQENQLKMRKVNMRDEYDFKNAKRREKVKVLSREEIKIAVSLRLDPHDLALIKDEADRLGIPYQTLIGSIIHRFVTGELIDKKNVVIKQG